MWDVDTTTSCLAGLIEPHNVQRSDYASLQHTTLAWGTFGGLALADLYMTEQNRLERTAPNPLKINMLAMAAYLRTKGSWVRILPAAPNESTG